jgi:heme-degrading monooxygenase HmoA
MISRHWKGTAKPGEAANYVRHLKTDTFPRLEGIRGFIKASILTREMDQGTEFLVITEWESMGAIEHFTGADTIVAVVPEVVKQMMVQYDRNVTHYEIADLFTPVG